jgi:hypothetical protein
LAAEKGFLPISRFVEVFSDINLLGDRQGVVNLDPEITDSALNLGVAE